VGILVVALTYLHNYGQSLKGGIIRPKVRIAGAEPLGGRFPDSRLPIVALTVVLVIFAGIRYGIGSDYLLYSTLYRAIIPSSLSDSLAVVPQELAWVTLAFVLRQFTDSPYAILWIASLLTIVPILVAIRRKSADPTLSIFLFFFLGYYAVTFNAVRQSIAVSFLLLADTYRTESRLKWFTFSLIAVLFHSSALVAIIAQLLVAFWKPTGRSVVVMLIVGASLSLLLLRSGLAVQFASALNPRYETYLDDAGAGLGTWFVFAIRVLIIFIALASPRTDETSKYLAFVCVSAVVLLLGTTNVVFARFEPYFGIFAVLLLPNQLTVSKQRGLIIPALVVGSLVYFGFHISSFNGVVPYTVIPELASDG
jgi:hypothetical protein